MEWRKILERALERVAASKPDVIGVSAGFDAFRDPSPAALWNGGLPLAGSMLRIPVFQHLEAAVPWIFPDLVLGYLLGLESKPGWRISVAPGRPVRRPAAAVSA